MIDIWKSIYLVNTFGIISNKKAKKPSTVCHMSSMWQLAKKHANSFLDNVVYGLRRALIKSLNYFIP